MTAPQSTDEPEVPVSDSAVESTASETASGDPASGDGSAIGSADGSAGSGAPASAAPTSAPLPSSLEDRALKLLRAAVATEHAAIWSYGLISAYAPKDADLIRTNRNGHIFRRDAASDRILAAGGKAVQPRAAYSVPVAVDDPESARKLARVAEEDCARAWRAVIGSTDSADLRTFSLSSLSDSAVRLAMLRKLSKLPPFTTPFPGKTG